MIPRVFFLILALWLGFSCVRTDFEFQPTCGVNAERNSQTLKFFTEGSGYYSGLSFFIPFEYLWSDTDQKIKSNCSIKQLYFDMGSKAVRFYRKFTERVFKEIGDKLVCFRDSIQRYQKKVFHGKSNDRKK